jgi:uncharacterized membrane protein YbaN (DUF454 family)
VTDASDPVVHKARAVDVRLTLDGTWPMKGAGFLRRGVLIAVGTLSVGLGMAGIFLPLLPTTVFFLAAAACFVRSSDRLYRWLLKNKLTGSYITHYREGNGIPARAKAVSIGLLWITLVASAFMVQIWWIWLILGMVAVGVPIFLVRLPSLEREEGRERSFRWNARTHRS